MKILHIITDLSIGGAQMMLYNLLSGMHGNGFETEVISLVEAGPAGPKIASLDIPVWSLGMRRGVPNPVAVLRLARYLRRNRPDVIQTWMYHANVVGGIAATLAGGVPVVWAIHHTSFEPEGNKRSTIWTAQIGGVFSHWLPRQIVIVSEKARQLHEELGYADHKMVVIPNGFDLRKSRPDPVARLSVRHELGIPEEARLIGMVGRFHPQKDHHTFVQAAALVHANLPDVHFLLCGYRLTWDNSELSRWIDESGLRQHFHLLGRRDDVPRLHAALDLATLSAAYGEAFPLVVGEAMACGVPCVVTDVGDSAMIVGDTGRVVPIRDPQALAVAWRELLAMEPEARIELGQRARQRIEENFSLPAIVAQYEMLYQSPGYVRPPQFA